MPMVEFHLCDGQFPDAVLQALVREAASRFAAILQAPPDRVRVVATVHRPGLAVMGASAADDSPPPAPPFFIVHVLAGRPLAQRQAVLAGMTDVLEQVLAVPRAGIRGVVHSIDPDDWGIAGQPASALRASEIAARKAGEERS